MTPATFRTSSQAVQFFLERSVLLRPLGNVVYVLALTSFRPTSFTVYDVITEAIQPFSDLRAPLLLIFTFGGLLALPAHTWKQKIVGFAGTSVRRGSSSFHFSDSSVLTFPVINDLLLIELSIETSSRMPLYA